MSLLHTCLSSLAVLELRGPSTEGVAKFFRLEDPISTVPPATERSAVRFRQQAVQKSIHRSPRIGLEDILGLEWSLPWDVTPPPPAPLARAQRSPRIGLEDIFRPLRLQPSVFATPPAPMQRSPRIGLEHILGLGRSQPLAVGAPPPAPSVTTRRSPRIGLEDILSLGRSQPLAATAPPPARSLNARRSPRIGLEDIMGMSPQATTAVAVVAAAVVSSTSFTLQEGATRPSLQVHTWARKVADSPRGLAPELSMQSETASLHIFPTQTEAAEKASGATAMTEDSNTMDVTTKVRGTSATVTTTEVASETTSAAGAETVSMIQTTTAGVTGAAAVGGTILHVQKGRKETDEEERLRNELDSISCIAISALEAMKQPNMTIKDATLALEMVIERAACLDARIGNTKLGKEATALAAGLVAAASAMLLDEKGGLGGGQAGQRVGGCMGRLTLYVGSDIFKGSVFDAPLTLCEDSIAREAARMERSAGEMAAAEKAGSERVPCETAAHVAEMLSEVVSEKVVSGRKIEDVVEAELLSSRAAEDGGTNHKAARAWVVQGGVPAQPESGLSSEIAKQAMQQVAAAAVAAAAAAEAVTRATAEAAVAEAVAEDAAAAEAAAAQALAAQAEAAQAAASCAEVVKSAAEQAAAMKAAAVKAAAEMAMKVQEEDLAVQADMEAAAETAKVGNVVEEEKAKVAEEGNVIVVAEMERGTTMAATAKADLAAAMVANVIAEDVKEDEEQAATTVAEALAEGSALELWKEERQKAAEKKIVQIAVAKAAAKASAKSERAQAAKVRTAEKAAEEKAAGAKVAVEKVAQEEAAVARSEQDKAVQRQRAAYIIAEMAGAAEEMAAAAAHREGMRRAVDEMAAMVNAAKRASEKKVEEKKAARRVADERLAAAGVVDEMAVEKAAAEKARTDQAVAETAAATAYAMAAEVKAAVERAVAVRQSDRASAKPEAAAEDVAAKAVAIKAATEVAAETATKAVAMTKGRARAGSSTQGVTGEQGGQVAAQLKAPLKMLVLALPSSTSPARLLWEFPDAEQVFALFERSTGVRKAVVVVFAPRRPPKTRQSAVLGCRLQPIVQTPEAGNNCTRIVWRRNAAAAAASI
eukprot:CAMPEP_0119304726 /NCGR_PEP_ID=MMETSP1333-20130426/5875_1 /TAXON_ID=418940 /ORGANISM="Scyphosphaera apsteinii, Strain RCC1455" /LENGTH=1103 /DNA_ID=CAMNT_0007307659 /DNA_START=81 /DNA_END=3392 /DNA_ORIENTATION=-